MAYSTANPPALYAQMVGGAQRLWMYRSTDAAATVDAAGYFTNGLKLGMKVGDIIWVFNTTSSITTFHQVSAVSLTGTDVNDLTAVTQTDTD